MKLMNTNKDFYVCQKNSLIKAKYSMTKNANILLRLAVSQIIKEDKEFFYYSISSKELSKILEIDEKSIYREIKKVAKEIASKYLEIEKSTNNYKIINWCKYIEYDNGILTICISDELKPYLLNLNSWFTQYQIKYITQFNSSYAIRLYEIIKCEDGVKSGYNTSINISIADLRKYLNCENKQKKIIDFKRNVIEISVREINEKSDILIIPHYKKTSRTITSIDFEIHENIENQMKKNILKI